MRHHASDRLYCRHAGSQTSRGGARSQGCKQGPRGRSRPGRTSKEKASEQETGARSPSAPITDPARLGKDCHEGPRIRLVAWLLQSLMTATGPSSCIPVRFSHSVMHRVPVLQPVQTCVRHKRQSLLSCNEKPQLNARQPSARHKCEMICNTVR